MAPLKSAHPLRMPPESGGIPGRVHFWEVPLALMLSPGWVPAAFREDLALSLSIRFDQFGGDQALFRPKVDGLTTCPST